jgi:UDP-2,3-diacylglucosamine hydrolase
MKPIQAVFISDLHLHPQMLTISEWFTQFIDWAKEATEAVYILGDFLHVWAGDDAMDSWSREIASQVEQLSEAGVHCYFMPGNRDFLLGSQFAKLAKWQVLPDPSVIKLGGETMLLSHGDRYCTADKKHQWFRWLTRRPGFIWSFTRLPLKLRLKWVNQVRNYSQRHHSLHDLQKMDVVDKEAMLNLHEHHAKILIHGHTHQCKTHVLVDGCTRFVLSDWDDKPMLLCYYKAYGLKFIDFDAMRI